MTKRAVVRGKVMRTPSLAAYDNKRPIERPANDDVGQDFRPTFAFDREYASTHDADRALLVRLGVNGEVPFHMAAANAGLVHVGGEVDHNGKQTAWVAGRQANDNNPQAAVAA